MAVKLIANYAKRLGLPGYSSHQFSVSVETELHDSLAAEMFRAKVQALNKLQARSSVRIVRILQ